MNTRAIVWESWALDAEADLRFRRAFIAVAVPIALLALAISTWRLHTNPAPPGTAYSPGRYAELLPPAPPAPLAQRAEEPKPAIRPQVAAPAQKAVPRRSTEKPRLRESAREQAQRALAVSGVADSLADLRDRNLAALAGAAPLNSAAIGTKGGGERRIASTARASAEADVGQRAITRQPDGVGLGERRTVAVTSPLGTEHRHGRAGAGGSARTGRRLSDIQLIFDRHKGLLTLLYMKARRDDPKMQGRLIVRLVIAPDGHVVDCTLVSSQLGNPAFEQQVIRIIKGFDFGAEDVPTFTYNGYPIDFVPPQ